MTRQDVANQMAKKCDLTSDQCDLAIIAFTDSIIEALKADKHVEIRGFGSFDAKLRKPKLARNISTGETINVPARKKVTFKPSKAVRYL